MFLMTSCRVIPAELGSCLVLEYLDIARNSFQGNIPLSFISLRGVRILDLSSNNLSGTIPKELQNLSALLSLNLSFNYLEGEVPSGVFKMGGEFQSWGTRRFVEDSLNCSCQHALIFCQERMGKGSIFQSELL